MFEVVKLDTGNREHGPEASEVPKSTYTISSELRKAKVSTTSATSSQGSNLSVLKPRTHSTHRMKEIPRENLISDAMLIFGCQHCKGHFFEIRISKCVTNMVRHRDQCEREEDVAVHWDVHSSSIDTKIPKSIRVGIHE